LAISEADVLINWALIKRKKCIANNQEKRRISNGEIYQTDCHPRDQENLGLGLTIKQNGTFSFKITLPKMKYNIKCNAINRRLQLSLVPLFEFLNERNFGESVLGDIHMFLVAKKITDAQRILSIEFEHASNWKHPALYEMFPIIVNPFPIIGNPFPIIGNPFPVIGNPFPIIGNPFPIHLETHLHLI